MISYHDIAVALALVTAVEILVFALLLRFICPRRDDIVVNNIKPKVTWLPSRQREASLSRAIETGVARAVYRHRKGNR